MIIKADPETFFVFDLDDTLYNEIEFLKSAFKSIAIEIEPKSHNQLFKKMFDIYNSGGNTFEYLMKRYPEKKITMENLLYLYRNHFPKISLKEGVLKLLKSIKSKNGKIGIITNGRSVTQRSKIKALGIEHFIDELIISEEFGNEKSDESVYKYFLKENPGKKFYFFGDNIDIDFITAKKLGWCCIGVTDKKSIHKQNVNEFSDEYLPHFFIKKFIEIEII